MSVTSILRDLQNNVSIVRMTVTDTLATVTSPNYIKNHQAEINVLNSGTWEWFPSDFLAIGASDGNVLAVFTDNTFASLADIASIGSAVTAQEIQQQAFTYAVASGSANNYNVTLTPAPAAYTDGMYVMFRSVTNNTGASAANVNGLGAVAIVTNNNAALVGGEILNGGDYLLIYNSSFSKFVLINSSLAPASITAAQIQNQAFTYAVDSGAANAYVVALSPAISAYADGQYLAFQATNANSGASTIAVNGLTAQPIVDNANAAIASGAILAGGTYLLVYNGRFSAYVLVNSSSGGGGGIANDGMITNGIVTSTSTTNAKSTANFSFDQTNFNLVVGNGASSGTGNTNATAIGTNAIISGSSISGTMLLKDNASTFSTANRGDHLYVSFNDGMNFYSQGVNVFGTDADGTLSFATGSGYTDKSKSISTPTSGGSINLQSGAQRYIINPAGTLAALTLNFFKSPQVGDGQVITVSCSQIVTTLTIATPFGGTVLNKPSAFAAGDTFSWIYDTNTDTWYRTS